MQDPHVDRRQVTESEYNDANKLDLRNEIQERYSSHPIPWFQWVFGWLKLPAEARILELGCGSGALWQKNHARVPAGWKMVLSDLSMQMVKTARSGVRDLQLNFEFAIFDSQALPFAGESFDAVLAIGLLDYLPNLQKALSEVRRVLRPAGQIFASAGSRQHLHELQNLLRPYVARERAQVIGGEEARFGLENGEQSLAPFFRDLTRHDYQSSMTFHEAQPILNYVFSESEIISSMNLAQVSSFTHKVKGYIAKHGEFSVTVDKGLFTARK